MVDTLLYDLYVIPISVLIIMIHLRPFQTQGLKDKGLVFPVEFTVGRLMDIVDASEEEHSGGMFDWAGQSIPF